MSRYLGYLGRFALILVGFACAALAASAFFHLLAFGGLGFFDEDTSEPTRVVFMLSVPVVAAFIAYLAFIPAVIFFVLAEVFAWRGWLAHVLGGGAAAAAALFWNGTTFVGPGPPGNRLELAAIACGMVGGIAYWLVAGRSAGALWREPPEAGI